MSSPRLFNGQTVGQVRTSLLDLFDPAQVSTDGGTTGMWRAATPADFAANVSISGGLSVSVGNVAVTGGQLSLIGTSSVLVTNPLLATSGTTTIVGTPTVTISNPILAVSGNFGGGGSTAGSVSVTGGYLGITGTPSFLIANGVVPVSGSFTSTPGNTAVTGGQITIAGGFVGITGTHAVTVSNSITIANGILPVSGTFTATQGPVTIIATANTGAPLAVSGAFAATIGNIAVTGGSITIANPVLAVSGAFSSSVTIGNVAVTGVVLTSGTQELAYLAAISGALTTNLSAPAFVTGQVSIVGTPTVTIANPVLAVSGSFTSTPGNTAVTGGSITITNTTFNVATTGNSSATISNPIGVTGTSTDINTSITGAHPYNFLSIGGRATLPTGAGSASGYNVGDYAMLNINSQNGGVFTNQGCLDQTQDFVTCYAASTGVASNTSISGLYGTGILPNNPTRRSFFIQNLSTGQCWLSFSSTLPSLSRANIVLKAGVTSGDGIGGSYENMGTYTGPVSISGTAPAWFIAWEL